MNNGIPMDRCYRKKREKLQKGKDFEPEEIISDLCTRLSAVERERDALRERVREAEEMIDYLLLSPDDSHEVLEKVDSYRNKAYRFAK